MPSSAACVLFPTSGNYYFIGPRVIYALRLHEAGMIKSSPHEIIADGTDWRFLVELKRELKAENREA